MKKVTGDSTQQVTVIQVKGNSTLVQYMTEGVLSRVYVPTSKINNGFVEEQILLQGIPYGYPWGDIVLKFDSRKFANQMHQVDIWTVDDALKNPQKLWSALRATLADNLSTILEVAKSEKKGVKQNGR